MTTKETTEEIDRSWLTAQELIDLLLPDVDLFNVTLDTLLPEGEAIVMFGPEKCLKSTLAIELCLAASACLDWYGIRCPEPRSSLYIGLEGEQGELRDKVQRVLVKLEGADTSKVVFQLLQDLHLEELLASIRRDLDWRLDMIVLDPYRGCVVEEDDIQVVRRFVANIKSFDCRFLIVYHRSKPGKDSRTMGEMIRGFGALGQWAHILIGHYPLGEDAVEVKFKSRGPRPDPFEVRLDEQGIVRMEGLVSLTEEPVSHAPNKREQAQLKVWNLLQQSYLTDQAFEPVKMTMSELEGAVADNMSVSPRTAKIAWKKLVSEGYGEEETEGRHKYLWIHPLTLEPPWPVA